MSRVVRTIAALVVCAAASTVFGQSATPFKLGTFDQSGRTFVGVVLKDAIVIDLAQASAALKTPASKVAPPADMKDLIARYDGGVRARISEVIANTKPLEGAGRPSYVHDLKSLKTLPPIMYPTTMLNVAVNYRAHAAEMAGGAATQTGGAAQGDALPGTTSAPGIWERKPDDKRWNPYMFMKSPTIVIADGEAIRMPVGRTNIDWECELGVVLGRTADHVPIERAADYIFGYTLENDVSDRGGRGDTRHGSDWVLGKNHDTFAPMGPFIVPKEFVREPAEPAGEVHAQRTGDAGCEHILDDPFCVRAGVVRFEHPYPASGRCARDRQSRRRRIGAEASDLLQARRRVGLHATKASAR